MIEKQQHQHAATITTTKGWTEEEALLYMNAIIYRRRGGKSCKSKFLSYHKAFDRSLRNASFNI